MSHVSLRARMVAWVSCIALCIPASHSSANGMFAGKSRALAEVTRGGPSSAAQTGVLLRDGPCEVLLLRTTYAGPAEDFAWIVPVPYPPETDGVFMANAEFIDGALRRTEPAQRVVLPEAKEWMETKGAMPPARPGVAVRVLSREAVGDYDAAVLAADDTGALMEWLATNDYAVPQSAEGILADYVAKGWVFVAMRILDWARAERPVLADVSPIGIRFKAEELVFPLAISRVSAPELTCIQLIIIDSGPVTCREMPIRYVDKSGTLRAGDTYSAYRRQRAAQPMPALFCEAVGTGLTPYSGRYWKPGDGEDASSPVRQLPRGYWTQRFWALVARDDMVDLTFPLTTKIPETYTLTVELHPPKAALASFHQSPSAQTDTVPQRRAVLIACLAGAGVLVLGLVRRRVRGVASRAAGALLLALMALPGSGGDRSDDGTPSWVTELGAAKSAITDAIGSFRDDTGGLPSALEDLVVRPKTCLDASGNSVPPAGEWRGPYLDEVPLDPLSGEQVWAYDVLANPMVQSAAFAVKIVPQTTRSSAHSGMDASWTETNGTTVRLGGHGPHSPQVPITSPEEGCFCWHVGTRAGAGERIAPPGEHPDDAIWGLAAVAGDRAAVLLGGDEFVPPHSAPDGPYARAVTSEKPEETFGIREVEPGRHALFRLDPLQNAGLEELVEPSVSADILRLDNRDVLFVALRGEAAVCRVGCYGGPEDLVAVPAGARVSSVMPAFGRAAVVVTEPESGIGLGGIYSIGYKSAPKPGESRYSTELLARYYAERGRTQVAVLDAGYPGVGVAWTVPDSPRAGVRVFRLREGRAEWLPVTTVPPEDGWDYTHSDHAVQWIRSHVSDTSVPVLPDAL